LPVPNAVPAGTEWAFFRINPVAGPEEKFDRIAFPTPAVGYAASRDALYRTDDGGETWRPLDLREPGRVFVLHFTDANTGWLGTDRLRHTRDGCTWKEIGERMNCDSNVAQRRFRRWLHRAAQSLKLAE